MNNRKYERRYLERTNMKNKQSEKYKQGGFKDFVLFNLQILNSYKNDYSFKILINEKM